MESFAATLSNNIEVMNATLQGMDGALEMGEGAGLTTDKVIENRWAKALVNGEVKMLNQLGIPNNLAFQFLKIGTDDVEKIDLICTKHNMPIPTEMKMYYDVKSGKFEANYKYEEICSAKTGKNAGDIFLEWVTEIKG